VAASKKKNLRINTGHRNHLCPSWSKLMARRHKQSIYIIVIHISYTMVIEVKTKKWGNSIGVVIPSKTAHKLKLRSEETVLIEITKKDNVLKELFGSLKFNKPTDQILKEVREDLEGKWLK